MDVGTLLALVVFAWAVAIVAQRAARHARLESELLTAERADPHATVLPPSALGLRLAPELRWAAQTERAVGVAVFRFLGVGAEDAATLLREHMRGGEVAYQVRLDEFAVAFWDSDVAGTTAAIARLGTVLEDRAAQTVEAGYAMFPRDGSTYDELITAARERRTVLQYVTSEAPSTSPVPVALRPLAAALPGLALTVVTLLVLSRSTAWWSDWHDGHATATRLATAAACSAVIGVGAWVIAWLAARSALPALPIAWRAPVASRAATQLVGSFVAVATLIGFMTTSPEALTVASLAVLVTGLLSARTLVHANYVIAIGLTLGGAALVLVTRDGSAELANLGRLLAAAAVGCGVARALERWSWSVWLLCAASALDIWSVFGEHGTTRELATVGSTAVAASTRAISDPLSLDDLLYTGPVLDGAPVFAIGASDLALIAMCIATAHVWRLGARSVAVAMFVASTAAIGLSILRGDIVPVIPLLAIGYLVALMVRSADRPKR